MRDPDFTGYAPNRIPGVTPEEVIMVTTRNPSCDGGGGALGHPTIWMSLEGEEITCPYCSRTFRLAEGAEADHHH